MKKPFRERSRRATVFSLPAASVSLAPSIGRAVGANDRFRIAIVGCNGRGMGHIAGWLEVPGIEISHICDVDTRAIAKGSKAVEQKQQRSPKGERDFRKLLENPDIDAVSIAMPDHWHAPAAILACAAGKHVYLEKPGSHNCAEAALVVAAARKHKRVVQLGNQRRSWPWVVEAIEALKSGEVGKPHFARCWYSNKRQSIGHGKPAPVPDWLDWDLWQGPAPEVPFRDNVVHYNWHWFWHWGTGELAGNGVHSLDLALWGLELDLPSRITCAGNRYFYEDDWETPDTCIATYDFGRKGITWEGQSCAARSFEGTGFGVTFFAEGGVLVISGQSATFYDLNNKPIRKVDANQSKTYQFDALHFANFRDAVTQGTPLKADIAEGQKSALLCHLGNLAWRTGKTLELDPGKQTLISPEPEVASLWGRTYRAGWEPAV